MTKQRIHVGVLLAVLVSVAAAGCAASPPPASTVTAADLGLYEGADRMQKLIEGARKEGALTVYTSSLAEDIGKVVEALRAVAPQAGDDQSTRPSYADIRRAEMPSPPSRSTF